MRLLSRLFVLREVVLQLRNLVKKNAELRARAERAELQLAGCSAAALGWDLDAKPGDHGWSASYGDVVKLRREVEELRGTRIVFRGSPSDLATDVAVVLTPRQRDEFLVKLQERFKEAS